MLWTSIETDPSEFITLIELIKQNFMSLKEEIFFLMEFIGIEYLLEQFCIKNPKTNQKLKFLNYTVIETV